MNTSSNVEASDGFAVGQPFFCPLAFQLFTAPTMKSSLMSPFQRFPSSVEAPSGDTNVLVQVMVWEQPVVAYLMRPWAATRKYRSSSYCEVTQLRNIDTVDWEPGARLKVLLTQMLVASAVSAVKWSFETSMSFRQPVPAFRMKGAMGLLLRPQA